MIQTLGMSLAAALLFAIATGSPISVHGLPTVQDPRKKPGARKAKNAKAKISGEVFVK
jgi:hypothetical protein